NECKQQGKRNGEGDDERRPQVAKKRQKDQGDQNHTFEQSASYRVGGEVNQVSAIVIRNNAHSLRQDAVIQLIHTFADALQSRQRLFPPSHQNNALHNIGLVVLSDFSDRNLSADTDFPNLLQINRSSVFRRDRDISDIAAVFE